MAYTINRWDKTAIAVIEDGTVNQSLDIKLIGKNYAGYGEIQNEDMVFMLENFAGTTEPAKAIRGQIWYDTIERRLKYYTGESVGSVKVWKSTGGADYSNTAPTSPNSGDLWFDTTRDQLKVRTGSEWLTVGPQSAGSGVTQMISREVLDIDQNVKSIIAATVNDGVTYIISESEFRLDYTDTDSNIVGFNTDDTNLIKKGITLANTNSTTGVSGVSTSHVYWGTAGNALRLGGYIASDFVRSGASVFTNIVRFNDAGYTVGDSQDLAVFIDQGTDPVIQNVTGPKITFKVRVGSDIKTPFVIDTNSVIPGVTETFDLGSSLRKWDTVYATTFNGIATNANTLLVGTDYRVTSTSATANTIAVRDSSGNLVANTFTGNATSASRLATSRTINGVPFDGSTNIILEDSTRLPLAGGTMTGYITLHADPSTSMQAATKNYVDSKFGVGGALPISAGGTSATTAANARTNLEVPKTDGTGAGGTWSISITGLAANSSLLNGLAASTGASANTIAARNGAGDLYAVVFRGRATSAQYADLAEIYKTDQQYEIGTVVMIGGTEEATACQSGARAFGAVSEKPAYLMNDQAEGQPIALKGRIPVKVTGPVKKGQELVAADGGTATAGEGKVFAIALESNDSNDIKLVECLIL